jgi:orotate phosphoribosyltransferase
MGLVRRSRLTTEIALLLPRREGHFVYESGYHGELWLELERLCLQPVSSVQPLAEALAQRLREHRPEAISAPLVEGAFVGLIVASALRIPFTYSAPFRDEDAVGLFPVSYPIPVVLQSMLREKRVAIVNDVINAGSAVRGTLASLRECGAEPVAIGALATFGRAARELAATHDLPLETLASFPMRIWEPGACPSCAQGVPLTRF